MRITQGAFSFLPDLDDEQIAAQVRHMLLSGWAVSLEHTDDPHPRNCYWEMWGHPLFELDADQVDVVMRELRTCREAFGDRYIKLVAYDSSLGRQTTALSFIVNRPSYEPGFRLQRSESHDRVQRYALHPYAADRPSGQRYVDGGRG